MTEGSTPRGPPPEGFRVDLFCLASPKSATTWLSLCLDDHPDVTVARTTEPAFFARERGTFERRPNDRYEQGWDWYVDQFKDAGDGDRLADFSTQHLWNGAEAAGEVRGCFPGARFVVMLRDPVERLWSDYWGIRGKGGDEEVPGTFGDALEVDAFVDRSRYARHLEAWMDRFPRDRFRVHLLEDVREDARGVVRRTYEHLDVDPGHEPDAVDERVRTSRRSRIKPLRSLAETMHRRGLGPLVDAVNAVGLGPLIKRVGETEVEVPEMGAAEREAAWERVGDDVARLEGLLDRSLPAWDPTV